MTLEQPAQLTPQTRVRPSKEAALEDAFTSLAHVLGQLKVQLQAAPRVEDSTVNTLVKTTDALQKLVRTDIANDKHMSQDDVEEDLLIEDAREALELLGGGDIEVE